MFDDMDIDDKLFNIMERAYLEEDDNISSCQYEDEESFLDYEDLMYDFPEDWDLD